MWGCFFLRHSVTWHYTTERSAAVLATEIVWRPGSGHMRNLIASPDALTATKKGGSQKKRKQEKIRTKKKIQKADSEDFAGLPWKLDFNSYTYPIPTEKLLVIPIEFPQNSHRLPLLNEPRNLPYSYLIPRVFLFFLLFLWHCINLLYAQLFLLSVVEDRPIHKRGGLQAIA